jgi:hypothetical protein
MPENCRGVVVQAARIGAGGLRVFCRRGVPHQARVSAAAGNRDVADQLTPDVGRFSFF